MSWFSRKKKVPETPALMPKPQCSHKWRDFKWYDEATYYTNSHTYSIKIYEPYVCIHCKERRDELLLESTGSASSETEARNRVNEIRNNYKEHLDHRAIVEDEIKDMQLVDRKYLEIAQGLFPDKPILKT